MALVVKTINGKSYYYSFLSYFLADRAKSFSKYIGSARPSKKTLSRIEDSFRQELIRRISGRGYSCSLMSKDDVIRSLLFSKEFSMKFQKLTGLMRRKYDIDSTITFALTTLTTEEVDVNRADVENAFSKTSGLTRREQLSRNMLRAVDSIKSHHRLDKEYLLRLHRMIMATFEMKTPGRFRTKQVYLYRYSSSGTDGKRELAYRPPHHKRVIELLNEFVRWYNSSNLNPIEKAAVAHYNLYRIHPFLDGNKRICRLIFNKALLDGGFPLINISVDKETYFDMLVGAVEANNPQLFVGFALKQYYRQVRAFLTHG
jgi:Fic family protein